MDEAPIFHACVSADGLRIEIPMSSKQTWQQWRLKLAGQGVWVRMTPIDPAPLRKSKAKA